MFKINKKYLNIIKIKNIIYVNDFYNDIKYFLYFNLLILFYLFIINYFQIYIIYNIFLKEEMIYLIIF